VLGPRLDPAGNRIDQRIEDEQDADADRQRVRHCAKTAQAMAIEKVITSVLAAATDRAQTRQCSW
jgi:hypothetical protein